MDVIADNSCHHNNNDNKLEVDLTYVCNDEQMSLLSKDSQMVIKANNYDNLYRLYLTAIQRNADITEKINKCLIIVDHIDNQIDKIFDNDGI